MNKISGAAIATLILSITLYFTLFWGFDALRILTSPSYGLDDAARAQFIYIIGGWLGLAPVQLIKVSAFFGGVKLVVAGAFAWYFVDRFLALFRGEANVQVLEGALLLVVAVSILTAGLAARTGNGEMVRLYAIQLGLAFVTAALSIVERTKERRVALDLQEAGDELIVTPHTGSAVHS